VRTGYKCGADSVQSKYKWGKSGTGAERDTCGHIVDKVSTNEQKLGPARKVLPDPHASVYRPPLRNGVYHCTPFVHYLHCDRLVIVTSSAYYACTVLVR